MLQVSPNSRLVLPSHGGNPQDPWSTTGDDPPPPPYEVDRISDLSDTLLLTILSFLPTHLAARTSILSRRFRTLWSSSPSLYFDRTSFKVTPRFVKMVDRALLSRDYSASIECFGIKSSNVSRCLLPWKSVLRWITRACELNVKRITLTVESATVQEVCSTIFSINSLEYLHITTLYYMGNRVFLPVNLNVSCTQLTSLHLLMNMCSADLHRLFSGLPVLEYLELGSIEQDTIDISSHSVKTLKLQCKARQINLCFPNLGFMCLNCKLSSLELYKAEMPLVSKAEFILSSPVEESILVVASILTSVLDAIELKLSIQKRMEIDKTYIRCHEMLSTLPRLEWLELSSSACHIGLFQVEMPLLRKAEIMIDDAREEFVLPMGRLLKCVQNVVNLRLNIRDHEDQLKPFHIFEPNTQPPLFPHLVKLELYSCFHEAAIEDVIGLIGNSPVLNCLEMNHMDPLIYGNQHKKKTYWQSKLPRNSEGNFQHAYFTNLNLSDEKGEVVKLLSRRLTSKKRKM